MAEYIDREALFAYPIRKDLCDQKNAIEDFILGIECVMEYAETLPIADVEPVRHGHWVDADSDSGEPLWRCSACCIKAWGTMKWAKFCPHCGAKMKGVKSDDI